jgi:hydroxymethylpyrimidine pyrophosphatase-like HAD family hydrolase
VVDSFDPYVAEVGKLVGVCDDAPRLAELEGELQSLVGQRANAVRSQTYYLDLTHPHANKGHAVEALARHAGCSTAETVVLGDQQNDIPMFRVAGYSICMGNGSPDAQKAADDVTGGNDSGGWAEAVDRLILPRLRTAAPEGGR